MPKKYKNVQPCGAEDDSLSPGRLSAKKNTSAPFLRVLIGEEVGSEESDNEEVKASGGSNGR